MSHFTTWYYLNFRSKLLSSQIHLNLLVVDLAVFAVILSLLKLHNSGSRKDESRWQSF